MPTASAGTEFFRRTHPAPRQGRIVPHWWRMLLCCAVMLACCYCPAFAATPTHLKVGVYSYEPLVFFDVDQGAQGLWVEILEHLAEQEGWTLEYIPGTWDECYRRLEKGEIDLLPNIAYTPQREKWFDFTEEFLFLDWGVVYAPKGKTLTSIFDLKGKRVSALKGSIYLEGFRSLLEQFGIKVEIIEVDEFKDVFTAIQQGESDAGISAQVNALKYEGNFAIERTHIFFSPVKIRIAAPKHATPQLIATLDRHFKQLKLDKKSFYYQRLDYWMTQYSRAPKIPLWMTSLILFGLACALILGGFVVLLRSSVKTKTKSLQQSEQRFRSLFNLAPLPLCFVNQDGALTYINNRFIELFGYTLEDIPTLEHWWLRAYPDPEYRTWVLKSWTAAINKSLQKGGDIEPLEYLVTCKNGRVREVEISGATIGDSFLASFIDQTERNRQQKDQRQLEQKMLHSQKLESLGVLAGGIAHDFNNILMAVMGNTELAQRRLEKDSPTAIYLQRIKQATNKAKDLANQMLAYSGKGKFTIAPIDLSRTIVEMQQILEVSVSKKVVLSYALADQLPSIEADVTQIQQVIMNLVINASESIQEPQGRVKIATGVATCDRSFLNACWHSEELAPGSYVFLEVTDNGSGMNEETLNSIFDPFYTTKFAGRGLGMAAVQGIVRGHKGAIHTRSSPGHGSTFKVLFPVSTRVAQGSAPQPQLNDKKETGLVLLVDDEASVRETGRSMLQELGYEVVIANNGEEAVAEFQQRLGAVRFVVMDMTMPILNGDEAALRLRQIDPDLKIILVSGYKQQEQPARASATKTCSFLQKPYQLQELQAAIAGLDSKNSRAGS